MKRHRILCTFHHGDTRVVVTEVTVSHETVLELRAEKLVWDGAEVVSSAPILFADDMGELAELAISMGRAAFDAASWALARVLEREEEDNQAASKAALKTKN